MRKRTLEDWAAKYWARDWTAPAQQSTQPQPAQEMQQDSAVCALDDCDEPAAHLCVCCNRRVCFYDISAVSDNEPGLCHECLLACAGGMACKAVL